METSKLMTPLFYGGMFNADGKRMRSVFEREVSNGTDAYRLWRSIGAPDRDYPRTENDTHLLYVELHGYLAPLRMTECDLINRCGDLPAMAELYGGLEGRRKYFDELQKAEHAYTVEIPKALETEGETIRHLGSDPARQADYIKKQMEEHISAYLEAKANGGQSFPDFIGAAALDEIGLCRELSVRYREKKQAEHAAWKAEMEAKQKRHREEINRKAEQQICQAVQILRQGGVLQNEVIRLYRDDGGYGSYSIVNHLMRLYGVDVPLRTQGWINEKLVSVRIENGRCYDLRYRTRKGGRCSEKIFACVNDLIEKAFSETGVAA